MAKNNLEEPLAPRPSGAASASCLFEESGWKAGIDKWGVTHTATK